MLRTSERSSFTRCPWQWYWGYVERKRPLTDKPALRFGTLIHQALAGYYVPSKKQRGPHPAQIFEKLYEEEIRESGSFSVWEPDEDDEDGKRVDAGELGVAMLDNYISHYDRDDEWEVLETEIPFQTIVYDGKQPWFTYVGTLDGIWRNRDTGKLWIPDHKTITASRIDTRYLRLDEQASSYWTFGVDWIYDQGYLPKNQKISGMLFNYLRKAMPDDRPVNERGERLNKNGSVSKRQPPPYFLRQPVFRDEFEKVRVRMRVANRFAEMEEIRNGTKEPEKSPGQMVCSSCAYLDICELHEVGADYQELVQHTMRDWEPYSDHEIEGERH